MHSTIYTSSNEHWSWGLCHLFQASKLSSCTGTLELRHGITAVETWSVSQDLQPTRTEWDANCSRTIFFLTTGTRCIVKRKFKKKKKHVTSQRVTSTYLDKWRFLQLPHHILTLVGLQDDAKCELSYRLPNHAMSISSHLGSGNRVCLHRTTAVYVPIELCKCASVGELETLST